MPRTKTIRRSTETSLKQKEAVFFGNLAGWLKVVAAASASSGYVYGGYCMPALDEQTNYVAAIQKMVDADEQDAYRAHRDPLAAHLLTVAEYDDLYRVLYEFPHYPAELRPVMFQGIRGDLYALHLHFARFFRNAYAVDKDDVPYCGPYPKPSEGIFSEAKNLPEPVQAGIWSRIDALADKSTSVKEEECCVDE